jgi:uncharacterized delta-60 repeat protein
VSCAALLEGWAPSWRLDRKESTRRALKYRREEGVLIVNHDGRGWWDPQSTAKGDIFDLVQYLDPNLNFGQVRRELRRFVGVPPTFPQAVSGRAKNEPGVPIATRWMTRPRLRRASAVWNYLAGARRLPAQILAAAGSGGLVSIKAIGAPTALALLSNGDILALAGETIVEFGANGNLRSSVTSTTAGATVVAISQGGSDVFQANGDFVFSTSAPGEVGRRDADIQLLRFLPQGSIDATFKSPVFDFGADAPVSESARALAVQPNGKILAGGASGQFGAGGFGLARFNAGGGFDAAFGSGGKVTTPFPNASAGISALVLQPDGKTVAVGTETVNVNGTVAVNLAAARYLSQ